MSITMNPAARQLSFGARPTQAQPKQQIQPQPQFSGLFTKDADGETRVRYGRVAAAVLATLGVTLGPVATFDKVAPTESCAITNSMTGNVHSAGPGLAFRPWLFTDSHCFTTADTRVTEDSLVRGDDGQVQKDDKGRPKSTTRSIENVYVNAPISLAWKPNTDEIPKVYKQVFGPGGTDDPSLKASKDQIKDSDNAQLYENALYSEFRGMRDEIISLIPASQLNTVAAKNTVHDAIINGYNPQDIYNKFKAFQIGDDKANTGAFSLIASGKQPSLQQRITDRYGVQVITIVDADLRDTEILDPDYKAALDKLGQYPTLQRQADEQKTLNEKLGDADVAKAKKQAEAAAALDTPEAKEVYCVDKTIEAINAAKGGGFALPPGSLCSTSSGNGTQVLVQAPGNK